MAEGSKVRTQTTRGLAWAGFGRTWPVVIAAMLGAGLIYGVGFAGASVIHDSAHDTRHSLSFPCH